MLSRAGIESRQPGDGQDVIDFCHQFLKVPEGVHVGLQIVLRDWQQDIIRGIYDNPEGTRRAIISFGRKNGKTALTAMLLLAHLVGPMARRNYGAQICSAAQSREQASIVFRYAAKMVRQSPELNELVRVKDSSKALFCGTFGTEFHALSAEADTAYGRSDALVIHDELSRVKGPRSELYEALETGQSAHANPLSIIISTQAPTDADLLSELINRAQEGSDPRVRLFLWTADEDADPFAEETIRQANPAFGDFQNALEILDLAEQARGMPSREAEYRNLILNQRVEVESPFVSMLVWKKNDAEPDALGPIYGGLDLSTRRDLTALVLVSPLRDQFHVDCTFWLPAEGLRERARQDRVPYDRWAEEGFIKTTPGHAIEYKFIAEHLRELFERKDVRKIAFDRWNMDNLRGWLVESGIPGMVIDERFVDFGQGTKSMHPALEVLGSALANGMVRHGNNPVLTMCAANAVVKMDEAGWTKLDKKKSRGRIDGLVAMAMAVSLAAKEMHGQPVYNVPMEKFVKHVVTNAQTHEDRAS